LACVRGDEYEGMRSRSPIAARYGALSVSEIISREIAGNRRGTGDLTGWLVSLWR
jgi:hypothetical protein